MRAKAKAHHAYLMSLIDSDMSMYVEAVIKPRLALRPEDTPQIDIEKGEITLEDKIYAPTAEETADFARKTNSGSRWEAGNRYRVRPATKCGVSRLPLPPVAPEAISWWLFFSGIVITQNSRVYGKLLSWDVEKTYPRWRNINAGNSSTHTCTGITSYAGIFATEQS